MSDIPRTRDGIQPGDADDLFARRVAKPLRGQERLDASFEARVMSAVLTHAEQDIPRERAVAWWRRGRAVRVTPLTGLLAAAALAGVAALGALGGARLQAGRAVLPVAPTVIAAAPETVHVVRFVLRDRDARAVSLVGDFNGWSRDAVPLEFTGAGDTWVATVTLPPGRHEYAFVVRRPDGERWVADPAAPTVRDEFDTESSVIMVGAGAPPDRRS